MLQMRSAKEVIAIMFDHMTDNENDNRFNLQRGEVYEKYIVLFRYPQNLSREISINSCYV